MSNFLHLAIKILSFEVNFFCLVLVPLNYSFIENLTPPFSKNLLMFMRLLKGGGGDFHSLWLPVIEVDIPGLRTVGSTLDLDPGAAIFLRFFTRSEENSLEKYHLKKKKYISCFFENIIFFSGWDPY